MPNPEDTMTLAQHAECWWREQGNSVPPRPTSEYDAMYEAWIVFAFADFRTEVPNV